MYQLTENQLEVFETIGYALCEYAALVQESQSLGNYRGAVPNFLGMFIGLMVEKILDSGNDDESHSAKASRDKGSGKESGKSRHAPTDE